MKKNCKDLKALGRALSKLRESAGHTQKSVGDAMDISKAHVSAIEHGRVVKIHLYEAYANVLGCSLQTKTTYKITQ